MLKFLSCSIVATLMTCASTQAIAEDSADNDVKSVAKKDRPSYDPLGIRAKSFEIFPSVSIGGEFDDNIFSTNNNEESDFVTVISPKVNVISNWNNHLLAFNASTKIGRYADNGDESYEDFKIGTHGRYDILRGTSVSAGLNFEKKHEERGSPDDARGIKPTQYNIATADLGFIRDLNKISVSLDGQSKSYNFDNTPTTTGIINSSIRNRDEYKLALALGYEFFPNYKAFIRSTYDVRKYDDTSILNRSSDGYDVVVGTAVNISGKIKGSIYVGYMDRSIDDITLSGINGFKFGGDLLWNVTGITTISASLDRSIEETSLAGSSGYITTRALISADHELRHNVILTSAITFDNNEYEGGPALQRNDDIYGFYFDAKYLLNRNIVLSAKYDYLNRESNIANSDYVTNRFMLRTTLSY